MFCFNTFSRFGSLPRETDGHLRIHTFPASELNKRGEMELRTKQDRLGLGTGSIPPGGWEHGKLVATEA